MNERDASVWALDAGVMTAKDFGGSFIGSGQPRAFTPAGDTAGLIAGLSNPSTEPYLRPSSGIAADAAILATRLASGTPAIIGGSSGSGPTLITGQDRLNQNLRPSDSQQRALDAPEISPNAAQPNPEPSSIVLLCMGCGIFTFGRKKLCRRQKTELTA